MTKRAKPGYVVQFTTVIEEDGQFSSKNIDAKLSKYAVYVG